MNLLITGGAGYIGSHTAKVLAQAGHRPVVFDNLGRGHREVVRWGPLVEADLADRGAIEKAIREYEIEAVVHFAAFAYVGESMKEPGLYFGNNVGNSQNLLNALRATGVRKIVFSSTCATYGDPVKIPIAEDHPQRPVNPYGESKLMVERLLYWFGVAHDLEWVALRYFNAAGADADGQLGEEHAPETHLIPLAIAAAAPDSSQHLEIYGTDYDTPDGTAIRDYLHVTDLAEAHVAALRYLGQGGSSTAFNLGTGRGYSVREVAQVVQQVSGSKVRTKEVGRRAGDPPSLIADPGKANRELGWFPRQSSMEEIVRTAWQWKTRHRTDLLSKSVSGGRYEERITGQ